jgi:DnaK suppressor protein
MTTTRQGRETVSSVNIQEFRRALENKQKDLLATPSSRDEIAIEITADEIDRLQQQLSREVTIHSLDRTSKLLKSVKAALQRIDDEIFGVCLRCERPIHDKRLKAIPWASHCMVCQEVLDHEHTRSGEQEDGIGFAA